MIPSTYVRALRHHTQQVIRIKTLHMKCILNDIGTGLSSSFTCVRSRLRQRRSHRHITGAAAHSRRCL